LAAADHGHRERIGTDAGHGQAPNKGIESLAPTGSDPVRQDVTITGNTVSGNTNGGIVAGGVGLKVLLNRVGPAPTTLANLGNGGDGILVTSEGAEVRGNLVGHNADAGIRAVGAKSIVADNQVGQPSDAETDIGNANEGIVVAGSGAAVTGNVVGHNDGAGISVLSSAKGEVRGNRIGSNAGPRPVHRVTIGGLVGVPPGVLLASQIGGRGRSRQGPREGQPHRR
jgi:parallel beta-helix repeat protein